MMQNMSLLSAFIQNTIENNHKISNDSQFKTRMQFHNIIKDIDDFLRDGGGNQFVYISGIKGVGKSTLLLQIQDYLLKKQILPERILCFSARSLKQLLSNDFSDVIDLFINNFNYNCSDEKLFILIDEAHEIVDWFNNLKFISLLSNNIFIVFAGSFTLDFQKNIGTTFESKNEVIYPLSFKDYLAMNFSLNIAESIPNNLIKTLLTGELNNLDVTERKFYKSFPDRDVFFDVNFEKYLSHGAFPAAMNLNRYWAHKHIYNIIENIIEKDVFHNFSFDKESRVKIFRMLASIAFQKPDSFSRANVARFAKLSYSQVKKILTVLEQNQLILHINPYDIGNVRMNKSSRFYFFTPNFNAAINSQFGDYNIDEDYFLNLIESLIVSILLKIKHSFNDSFEIFYPYKRNRANFLMVKNDGEIVPIEFGYGKKPKRYLITSMKEHGSEYGILISDAVSFIKKIDDVICIPTTTFALI